MVDVRLGDSLRASRPQSYQHVRAAKWGANRGRHVYDPLNGCTSIRLASPGERGDPLRPQIFTDQGLPYVTHDAPYTAPGVFPKWALTRLDHELVEEAAVVSPGMVDVEQKVEVHAQRHRGPRQKEGVLVDPHYHGPAGLRKNLNFFKLFS